MRWRLPGGDSSRGDGRLHRASRSLGSHRVLLHAPRPAFVHPHGGEWIEAVVLAGPWRCSLRRIG